MGSQNQIDMAGLDLIVRSIRVGAEKTGEEGNVVGAKQVTATTTIPPTAEELTAAFGPPKAGFIATVNPDGADTNCYLVFSTDTSWYTVDGVKALSGGSGDTFMSKVFKK